MSAFAADRASLILHSQDRGKTYAWLGPGTCPGPSRILPRLDLTAQLQHIYQRCHGADFRLRRVQRCGKGELAWLAGCDANDKNLIRVRDESLTPEVTEPTLYAVSAIASSEGAHGDNRSFAHDLGSATVDRKMAGTASAASAVPSSLPRVFPLRPPCR